MQLVFQFFLALLIAGAAAADVPPGTARTCELVLGPRSGQIVHFPPLPPQRFGTPCDDGNGSSGTIVPDDEDGTARSSKPSSPPCELSPAVSSRVLSGSLDFAEQSIPYQSTYRLDFKDLPGGLVRIV